MFNNGEAQGVGPRPRRFLVVLLACITLMAAACGSDGPETAVAAEPAVQSEPESEPVVQSEPESEPTTTSTSPEPEVGVRAGDVIVGEVELDLLKPNVRLTAEDPWNVADASVSGAVIMTDPDQIAPFTRGLLLLEAEPVAASIDEWAEANDDATIESRAETQVAGLDAIVYDISYAGDSEVAILTAKCCGGRIVVRNTEYYRLWTIETGRELPLAFFAPVLKHDTDWLDKAEKLVATMEIAEPDPEDLLGTWSDDGEVTWQIEANTWVATIPGGSVESSYSATGTTVELIDVSGELACGPNEVGNYEWAIVDDVLTLTLISDPCEGRGAAIDGRKFTRQ